MVVVVWSEFNGNVLGVILMWHIISLFVNLNIIFILSLFVHDGLNLVRLSCQSNIFLLLLKFLLSWLE